MAAAQKNSEKRVVFRRIRGKIRPITIRNDGGVNISKSPGGVIKRQDWQKAFKEHGRLRTNKERFHSGVLGVFAGATLFGAPSAILATAISNKKARLLVGAFGTASTLATSLAFSGIIPGIDSKVLSKRKLSQLEGLNAAKRLKIKKKKRG